MNFRRQRWWDLWWEFCSRGSSEFAHSCHKLQHIKCYYVLSFSVYEVIGSALWVFRFCSRHAISPIHTEDSSLALLNSCYPAERYPRFDSIPQFQPTLQATNFKGAFHMYLNILNTVVAMCTTWFIIQNNFLFSHNIYLHVSLLFKSSVLA
jgi:hypothetical protein